MFHVFLLAYIAAEAVFLPKITSIKIISPSFLLVIISKIICVGVLNVIAALLYILSNGFNWPILWCFLIISVFSAGIIFVYDLINKKCLNLVNENIKNKVEFFALIKNILSVAAIAAVCLLLSANAFALVNNFIEQFTHILTGLLLSTLASGAVIKRVLFLIALKPPSYQEDSSPKDNGCLTGIIERGSVFLALVCDVPQLAAVVYGLKALIKFDEYKKGSQYYITGNLLSIFFLAISFAVYTLLLAL